MSDCCPPTPEPASSSAHAVLNSIITCPHCGTARVEQMPVDACQIVYECRKCSTELRPKPGDCCVFCSYGSVPCPPVQAESLSGSTTSCCTVTRSQP